jgi:hypothetical protein
LGFIIFPFCSLRRKKTTRCILTQSLRKNPVGRKDESFSIFHIYIRWKFIFICVLLRIKSREMSQNSQILIFSEVWKEILEGIKHIYQLKPMTTITWMKHFT